jgi:hypothetical protein
MGICLLKFHFTLKTSAISGCDLTDMRIPGNLTPGHGIKDNAYWWRLISPASGYYNCWRAMAHSLVSRGIAAHSSESSKLQHIHTEANF